MSLADARIEEMKFLARLEREGPSTITGPYDGSPERQMIISLIELEYLNSRDTRATQNDDHGSAYYYDADKRVKELWQLTLTKPHDMKTEVAIGHKGRVRLAELRQQLQTGRGRDPTGLCLAKRHLHADLAIALLSANTKEPLSLAYIDMNGLKAINDKHSHASGDAAIKAYLEAVVSTFAERGEAYRGEGGDEAVIILPNSNDTATSKLFDNFVRQLARNPLMIEKTPYTLTASCGSVSTTNPDDNAKELEDLADKAQKRAKIKSKESNPRPSTIAVGSDDVKVFNPDKPANE